VHAHALQAAAQLPGTAACTAGSCTAKAHGPARATEGHLVLPVTTAPAGATIGNPSHHIYDTLLQYGQDKGMAMLCVFTRSLDLAWTALC
jgi:hypothetical protein